MQVIPAWLVSPQATRGVEAFGGWGGSFDMSPSANKPRLGRHAVLPPLHPQHLSSSASPSLPAHPDELRLHRKGGPRGAVTSLTVLVCLGSVLGQWQARAATCAGRGG